MEMQPTSYRSDNSSESPPHGKILTFSTQGLVKVRINEFFQKSDFCFVKNGAKELSRLLFRFWVRFITLLCLSNLGPL